MRHILLAFLMSVFISCSSGRPPVPPGTVPQQTTLSSEDEQYGHEVLSMLTQEYPLDTDDTRINRVRDIADRLAVASGNDKTPWHIHVLKDDNVKNAAATRGNYLFVWTGMFQSVKDDTELATIISHEMGHVLANHTAPSPQQEAAQILSGVMGVAASSVLSSQGYGGITADLAQMIIENIFQAALVNPQSQGDELEADHIGLFLMADAGYDPEHALAFWRRVQSDPDFNNATLQFFSSHPSTIERVQSLEKYIVAAKERYLITKGIKPSKTTTSTKANTKTDIVDKKVVADPALITSWMVAVDSAQVLESPEQNSKVVGNIELGQLLNGKLINRRWLEIEQPFVGFVRSSNLSPIQ